MRGRGEKDFGKRRNRKRNEEGVENSPATGNRRWRREGSAVEGNWELEGT
uniref:Uncharacterized protein n=1 Tax=Cucumis melo TaxID=3656 RepID=A0A9I9CGT3_CUCME